MSTKRILRKMAWQRAKGELLSMLETFWSADNATERDRAEELKQFTEARAAIEALIARVEGDGLAE